MNERPTLTLPGLDGQNPLGFFAALGLLRVLATHSLQESGAEPRLSFVDDGTQAGKFETSLSLDELKDLIIEDAQTQSTSVALSLAYDDEGNLVEPNAAGGIRDLKPSPDAARLFLERARTAPRRDADLAAGFFSELVQDNNGNTKPTTFHFTAGQQTFLAMVEELRRGITREDCDEALLGPWLSSSKLASLSWDSSGGRGYALRATDPSKEKRGSVAVANWLAVHALAFFPVSPARERLRTPCVKGGWKNSRFSWPLWGVPATRKAIGSLLLIDVLGLTTIEREALGVTAVLSSNILRSDQGGYGSFTPASVVLPRQSPIVGG
jgi:hypothetical protein